MKIEYATPLFACLLMVAGPFVIAAEQEKPEAPCKNAPSALPTVKLGDLLESVSKKSKKEFLVDRRVPSEVAVGQLSSGDVSYPQLLTILRNNDLAAVAVQGVVNIVPVGPIRQYALPILHEDDSTIADDEWVTRIMRPKRAGAAQMVPVLRPLLPQQGHLAAIPSSNTLIIVARYANAKRIAEMVQDMDEHTPEPAEGPVTESYENEKERIETYPAKRQAVYVADVIQATPLTINDQLRGYLLRPGTDIEKFEAVGLRTGDLLKDIDGGALMDPQQAKQAIENLGAADEVSVTVRRNGESEVVVLKTNLLNPNVDL